MQSILEDVGVPPMQVTTRSTTIGRPTVHDIPVSLKLALVDSDGIAYRDFRRTLPARWARVWVELLAAYATLGTVLAVLVISNPMGIVAFAAAALGALLIGYTIAYISNFLHEAAHYNL